MDEVVARPRGETTAHRELKRLAVFWAQAQGYTASALEVGLPQCRYRADAAACRLTSDGALTTAVFECKQARSDLQRDNRGTIGTRQRLETVQRRRVVIEKHLRVHYPALRRGDSLFSEFDSHDFGAIDHHNYRRVLREVIALQQQLRGGVKFEKLAHYHCANLFFLVLPNELYRAAEAPPGWGILLAQGETLSLVQRPVWHETQPRRQLQFLHRIALAGTRKMNKQLGITFEEILSARGREIP